MSTLLRERHCAEAIARMAGQHILRERTHQLQISLKAHNDLVTNVDRSTERLIIEQLQATFPEDQILGEEFGASTPSDQKNPDRRWIIDPIDGTLNFAHGIPIFCVSIGFQIDGRTVAASIYDPNRDELFSACTDSPTRLNGEPVHVSACDDLSAALFVTGFPLECTEAFESTIRQFEHMNRIGRGVRRLGSAALDLAYVASGRMDAFWEYDLQPWDTAAGYFLVEQAGGEVTDLHGDSFAIEASSILATNRSLHQQALSQLSAVA